MGAVAVLSPEELEARVAAAVGRALEPLRAEVARLRAERDAAPVTQTEAARRLGVSLRTIQRHVRDGTLPSVQVGRVRRIPAAALTSPKE